MTLVALSLLPAVLMPTACGTRQSNDDNATPTAGPEPTATAGLTPDIKGVDFSQLPAVENLLTDTGGVLLPEETFFADLTDDGADDAVVPISSGGSGGDVALAVFSYLNGDLEEILEVKPETGRLKATIENGALVTTQPVYGPEDPLCCPSQLKRAYYRWDGAQLVVDHEETGSIPTAKP